MTIEWDFILRIFAAGLLGGMIGFEREMRAKEAGIRTHFVVALGSALFMVISQFAFEGNYDRARVAAQVVSGIGFIGAGVIIFQKNAVRGVTTAAGLWVAAAIGRASGAGMYTVSIAATLMTIICLEAMHFITHKVGEKILTVTIFSVENDRLSSIIEAIKNMGADIHLLTVTGSEATFDLHVKHRLYLSTVEKILGMTKGLKVEIS